MSETGKIAAILVADIVGYSRLAGADEDLFDPAIAVHHGPWSSAPATAAHVYEGLRKAGAPGSQPI